MPTIKNTDGSDIEIDAILYAIACQVVNVDEMVEQGLMTPAKDPPSKGALKWFKEIMRIAKEAGMPEPTDDAMDKAYLALKDGGKAGALTPLGKLHFDSANHN